MGIFIDLFILIAVILVFLVFATQVLVPLFTGEPLFPAFRKTAVKAEIQKAEQTLESVAEAEHLNKVVTEIKRRTAEMDKQ